MNFILEPFRIWTSDEFLIEASKEFAGTMRNNLLPLQMKHGLIWFNFLSGPMNNILSGPVFPLTMIVLLLCLTHSCCRHFAQDAIREELTGTKDVTKLLLYFPDLRIHTPNWEISFDTGYVSR